MIQVLIHKNIFYCDTEYNTVQSKHRLRDYIKKENPQILGYYVIDKQHQHQHQQQQHHQQQN